MYVLILGPKNPWLNMTNHVYDIVFLGSRYGGDAFSRSMKRHDGDLRDDVIRLMLDAFGERFGLFGNGWFGNVRTVSLKTAHEVYQKSRMGLNVSLANFLECYTSDRMHRILGCGAALLTKSFPGMSSFGLVDGVNCIVWETPEEAVQLARMWLDMPEELAALAAAGAKLARENLTWNTRMLELVPYLDAVRASRAALAGGAK